MTIFKNIVFLFFFLPSISISQSIEQNIINQIDKILRYEIPLSEKETPGFIVGIIDGDSSFIVSYGHKVNESAAIPLDSYFDIGGLTKLYTAVVFNELCERTLIYGSEKMGDYFDELRGTEYQDISLLELIQHRSGIKRSLQKLTHRRDLVYNGSSPKKVGRAFEEISLGDILVACNETPVDQKKFAYNHHNYALAAEMIRRITGKSVMEWYLELDKWQDESIDSLPKVYCEGLDRSGRLSSKVDYGVYLYSLGGEATVRELLGLTRNLMQWHSEDKLLFQEATPTDIHRKIDFTRGLYRIEQGKHHTIYGHGGRSNRHSASIHFIPETQTAVVLLANSATGTKDLYLSLLAMINEQWKRK